MTTETTTRAAVLRLLARHGVMTGSALRRAVRSNHRGDLARALAELRAEAVVIAEPAKQGGTRYSLAPPVHPSPPERRRRNQDLLCDYCKVRNRRPTGRWCGAHILAGSRNGPAGHSVPQPNSSTDLSMGQRHNTTDRKSHD